MCGICGIVYLDRERKVEEETLRAMCEAIRHRGPDDEGLFIDGNLGIGSRRLSIIDVGGGHQPIHNEDGTIWITFNGEVYDFADLRKGLEKGNHKFYTRTDTEVIVHLYEERGAGCLEGLNGMFAFCIYDSRDHSLFLARDRVGKKPLYYLLNDKMFIFASEVKALLRHPEFERKLDLKSLAKYLAFEYVPWRHSIFEGVKKVLPGHYLVFKDGNLREERYWDIEFRGGRWAGSEREAEERLVGLLRESVGRRLVSDVPLGVFLSGGIDSSTVVSFMREFMPPELVRTFSIGFTDASFDESEHARRVAGSFGTTHHEDVFIPDKMLELVPEVVDFLDEPFADASVFPTYLLSKFTRRHVTVALGGDGGDELFAGYPTFQAHRIARFYEHVPAPVRQVLRLFAEHVPVSFDNISLDFQAKRFLKGMEFCPEERHQVWLGSFSPGEQDSLLRDEVRGQLRGLDVFEDIRASLERKEFRDAYDLVTYLYFKFYLVDDILVKVDRASMAASLEVRAPFLDREVVEFVVGLPTRYRLKRLRTKYLLKRAMKERLPSETVNRRKKGFGVPVAKWMVGPLREMMEGHFSAERLRRQGLFDEGYVRRLLREHFGRRRDNRKPLWTLLMFQMWYERYLGGS